MWLIEDIRECENSAIASQIEQRASEFLELGSRGSADWLVELCFCIMTANFNALRSMSIQGRIGYGFIHMSEEELAGELRACGHRFPNTRAKYIVKARQKAFSLKEELMPLECAQKREWLVKNVYGLGYKEASHFLRNVGFFDYAIIDFHILDLLEREGVIKRPKNLSEKNYLSIEQSLRGLSSELLMPLGILDLYLWFLETGKVLK